MPQQLACPNCRMMVTVLETAANGPVLCPTCRLQMAPVVEEEPIVAEQEERATTAMVAVELGADAPPPRATVLVEAAPPPEWAPTAAAQAWTTVARALDLQRIGAVAALFLVLLAVTVWPPGHETQVGSLVMMIAGSPIALLFVAGRLIGCQVPLATGARRWMAGACVGTMVATVLALTVSAVDVLAPNEPIDRVLLAARWTALGAWLLAEWAFLCALARIGRFVKRPHLAAASYMTGVVVSLIPAMWLALGPATRFLTVMETTGATLCVLYLVVLSMARRAVMTNTPDE